MKKVMLLAAEDLCGVLCNELGKAYIVYPCSNKLDAQDLLLQKPDVLIMNLFLPDMDSLEFLRTNAATLPPVVIALTPLINHDILLALSSLNITSLMRIPFCFDELKKQLAGSLAKKRPLPIKGEANIGCQKDTLVWGLRRPTPALKISEDQELR